MDCENKKAVYDAYFKKITDEVNIAVTAVLDALDTMQPEISAELRAEVLAETQFKLQAKGRTEFIQKLFEVGFSTEDVIKCDPQDFTVEEINRVKTEMK